MATFYTLGFQMKPHYTTGEKKERKKKTKKELPRYCVPRHLLLISNSYKSLLPLINELSSSRIHLCNTHRFISCLYAVL